MGAVAPVPWRSQGGRSGAGRQADQRADGRGGGRSGRAARREPLSQNAYKVQVAKTAVKRAILQRRRHRRRSDARVQKLMEASDSPKITVGVHCLSLRHKGMYITSVSDPDEATFYDSYDQTAYWCVETQTGFGPDGEPCGRMSARRSRGCCGH